MVKWHFPILLFLLATQVARAQSGIQHWDTEDGLSNNWVSQMIQDEEGYMWVATQYGLNRFDGYGFKAFHYQPNEANSLKANWVRAIVRDSTGLLWLGTFYGGLSSFEPETGTIEHYDSPADIVLSMDCDIHNAIWASSRTGLFVKATEQANFKKVLSGRISTVQSSSTGEVFALSKTGIHLFKNGSFQADTIVKFENNIIKQIYLDKSGVVWALKNDALLKITKQNNLWVQEVIRMNDTPNFNPFALPFMYEDRAQNLWISRKNDILIFDKTRQHFKTLSYHSIFFTDAPLNILSMYEDQHNNLWIGTTEGLFLRSPFIERFEAEEATSQLHNFQGVRELMKIDSILYIATTNEVFALNTKSPEIPPTKLLSERSYAFLEASDGRLYAGSYRLYQIDPETLKIEFLEASEAGNNYRNGAIWSLVEDRAGYIWIAAASGLHRFDPKTKTYEIYSSREIPSLKHNPVQDLLIDSKGRLWGASLWSGVYMLEQPHELEKGAMPEFRNFNYDITDSNSLSNSLSIGLIEDKDGAIWVGTDAGLNRIDGTNFSITRYLKKDGVIDEKIMALTCDDSGNIWGSTSGHGIFQFQPATETFSFYNRSDGLMSNNFLLSSVYKDQAGLLYFGSDAEVQIIDPKRVQEFKQPDINYSFTQLFLATQAENQHTSIISLKDKNEVELPHNYQSFTLHYTTLNFYQAENTNYEYQLEGLHTNWQPNGEARSVTFAGLRPGTYNLKLRPINSDLKFESPYISLGIRIHPPWWQQAWAYALYLLATIGLVYGLYRIQLRQQLQRTQAKRLQELDSLKTRFFTNITHELRTPLTIILGMAAQLKKATKKETQHKGDLIQRNGKQLLELINQLLDLSKLEAGKLPVRYVHGDLLVYLNYLLESFHSMAAAKNIRLHFLPEPNTLWMDYDAEKIKQIISNLLSNAIKHTPADGDIYLQVSQLKKEAVLTFRDTGKGIAAADLPHIFERFYQADTRRSGTGVGLSLVQELVRVMKGKISVHSALEKGTIFEVRLAIAKTEGVPLAKIEIAEKNVSKPKQIAEIRNVNEGKSEEIPLLLVVEDNADVRNFLVQSLKNDYRLELAEDGMIGIEKAQASVPDLIISDVMMPKKDGFELCKSLKTDKRTSHIPIILLTAKADISSRIEGLEYGADAYLYKPFEQAELEVRIRKLLELRQLLQARYQATDFWERRQASTAHVEDEFVLKIRALIEEHLTDAHFGIPQLCQKMGISRVHLHRKLKALTNQSTSHFIRRIRLQKARVLLQESELNVSEVAYEVGFADPTYFSRLYSETFGEPPSVTRRN